MAESRPAMTEAPGERDLTGHRGNILGVYGKPLREPTIDHRLEAFIGGLPRRAREMPGSLVEGIIERIRPPPIMGFPSGPEAEGRQGCAIAAGNPLGTLMLGCGAIEMSASIDDHPIVAECGLRAHQFVQNVLLHGFRRTP